MSDMMHWTRRMIRYTAPAMAGLAITLPAIAGTTSTSPKVPGGRGGTLTYQLSPSIYPKGVSTEAAYVTSVRRQIAGLERRLQGTRSAPDRIQLSLALANLRLARQAEPALTRYFLGDPAPGLLRQIDETASRATSELDAASKLLAERGGAPPEKDSKTNDQQKWAQAR
jgi:hypothetical protein